MDAPNIQIKVDTINSQLEGMLTRVKGMQAYLNRVVFKQYQVAQLERWKSAGTGQNAVHTSEGDFWDALQPAYYKRKRKLYSEYAYAGNQFLVASGKLLQKVINPDKIVTPKSITMRVPISYAPYVAEKRPFMTFGEKTTGIIMDGIRDFMLWGKNF